jgi:hypothetical protein
MKKKSGRSQRSFEKLLTTLTKNKKRIKGNHLPFSKLNRHNLSAQNAVNCCQFLQNVFGNIAVNTDNHDCRQNCLIHLISKPVEFDGFKIEIVKKSEREK